VAREPIGRDLRTPPVTSAEIEAALAHHAPVASGGSGPAYHFPAEITPPRHEVVRVTAETRALVRETFPWLLTAYDDWWPAFATLHDGVGVSVCFSSRIGPGAMAAGVETVPEFRGRGYAASATAAWGTAVRAVGRIPFYGTSWDNLASQGVARRLGLIMHASGTSWT
jgi:RimJ/RimL family protein N-acetyltransferase